MRGHDEREITLLTQVMQIAPNASARLRIKSNCRLIKKQHARIVNQSTGNFEPPLHAHRERAHQSLAPIAQFHHMQHFINALATQSRGHAIDKAVKLKILIYRQPIIQTWLLKHNAQTTTGPQSLLHNVRASNQCAAFIG